MASRWGAIDWGRKPPPPEATKAAPSKVRVKVQADPWKCSGCGVQAWGHPSGSILMDSGELLCAGCGGDRTEAKG